MPKSLFLLLRRTKCILPVTGSDALSIQLLVNNAIAHGKDTTGEMQKASLRDMTLAEQVRYITHDTKSCRQKTSKQRLPPLFTELTVTYTLLKRTGKTSFTKCLRK